MALAIVLLLILAWATPPGEGDVVTILVATVLIILWGLESRMANKNQTQEPDEPEARN